MRQILFRIYTDLLPNILAIFDLSNNCLFGAYASMLPQKSRTFPSVSGKNRNMPKRLSNQI